MAQAQQAGTTLTTYDISELGLSLVAADTQIATRRGEVAVRDLRIGDEVIGRDKGMIPLRWVGHLRAQTPAIRIPAGALGRNVPIRDCLVAPDARIWMRGEAFERAFTAREVLVPAKDLVGWRGIREDQTGAPETDYVLVVCDQPQILVVDGMQVEMHVAPDHIAMFDVMVADGDDGPLPLSCLTAVSGHKGRRRLTQQEAARVVEVQKRA